MIETSFAPIPYVDLAASHAPLKAEILAAVARVIDEGQFILGPAVAEFEQRFAALCASAHAVSVNSGTDALILGLRALGVGRGDEVITPPNSFVASSSCIALLGATPVFVDVRDDYTIDPQLIEAAITPRTKAIVAVHLTGRPCEMDEILAIAHRRSLHVVEDAAQAIGARYDGRPVGSFGSVGAFSLHPLKTLGGCGDGGIMTTGDAALASSLSVMRNLGLRTRDDCVAWSPNSRLDTLQAAILLVKLRYLEAWTSARRRNAARYRELLAGIDELYMPEDSPRAHSVYHTFVVQARRRDDLRAHLAAFGIGTSVHYPVPIHLSGAARDLGYARGAFPVSEQQARTILSLPVHDRLCDSDIERIATAIRTFYRG
jgi:dTDP-4-amino-4,6-dideoxygalactose transaminase